MGCSFHASAEELRLLPKLLLSNMSEICPLLGLRASAG
jgi:hypothetical protein